MEDLSEIRSRINDIDARISELFLERCEIGHDVAAHKRETGKPVLDRTRERANIAAAIGRVPPEFASHAASIQSILMEASREVQYRDLGRTSPFGDEVRSALEAAPAYFPTHATVACQGTEGAYQQLACDRMFRSADIRFFDSFEAVFEAVEAGACDFGVLPVENSTAGSVNHVFDLMSRHAFHIVRTCRLKVEHNLLVPHGTKKEDVRIVYSHQQAIAQCADYIAHLPGCRVHVCENTARAAELVATCGRTDVAAIASHSCSEIYGLDVAEADVADYKNNYTRFACIAKDLTIYPGADRCSLMAITDHRPGALFDVLAHFFALGINLTKLESRPIPGRDFEFMFYFDIECQAASPSFLTLMDTLGDVVSDLRYLGSYMEVV